MQTSQDLPELHTKRLDLVPCRPQHLEGLNRINSDPEIMRYITGVPESLEDTRAVIDRIAGRWRRFGYSWWSLIERASGDIVGIGCIQNLRRSGTEPDASMPLEIGWRVRRDRWREGIAIEAALSMADFAFTRLQALELYAVCHPDNVASTAVMRKLGMERRGIEHWYEQDVMTYVMTRELWMTAQRPPATKPTRV